MSNILFPKLERLILEIAPPHVAVDTAPETLAALQAWATDHQLGVDPLPVWNGACENTIYSSPEVNHAFRAWHDSVHLQLGMDMSPKGEAEVTASQMQQARDLGVRGPDLQALWLDTEGQQKYYKAHGAFPGHQRDFVLLAMATRLSRAIKYIEPWREPEPEVLECWACGFILPDDECLWCPACRRSTQKGVLA